MLLSRATRWRSVPTLLSGSISYPKYIRSQQSFGHPYVGFNAVSCSKCLRRCIQTEAFKSQNGSQSSRSSVWKWTPIPIALGMMVMAVEVCLCACLCANVFSLCVCVCMYLSISVALYLSVSYLSLVCAVSASLFLHLSL